MPENDFTFTVLPASFNRAEGRLSNGHPYYFRARGGVWWLYVGERDWPTGFLDWPSGVEPIAEGRDATNGNMTEAEIRRLISIFNEFEVHTSW